MNCTDAQSLLDEQASGPLEEEAGVRLGLHLPSCAPCRRYRTECQQLLAALEQAPSASELAALEGLCAPTLARWRAQERGRLRLGRWASLAAAAMLGALVSSAAWQAGAILPAPGSAPRAALTGAAPLVAEDTLVLAEADADEFDLSELEVSWTGEADVFDASALGDDE